MKPTIALFTGDPAGIGPELVARLLAETDAMREANIRLIGARSVIEDGLQVAGAKVDVGPLLVDWPYANATGFARGEVSQKNGEYMLAGLALGVAMCKEGIADAMCFAPLNKAALRAGGMRHADELHYFCEKLAFTGPSVEFNVLESLWTSRVTSHVPLKDVSGLLTRDGIADGIALLDARAHVLGSRAASHRRVRLQSAQRRQRRIRPRGDRHHRAGRRARALAGLSRRRPVSRRHDLRARDAQGRRLRRRRSRCTTTRARSR